MLEWLVIGAGPHGVHMALRLLGEGLVSTSELALLDPNPEPICLWRQRTRSVGMRFMRSPNVHHLGLSPFDLERFARSGRGRALARFDIPYRRPALALFNAHVEHLMRETNLASCLRQGQATAIVEDADGFRVTTTNGDLVARRVVFAVGGTAPHWPRFAREAQQHGASIRHVFDAAPADEITREGVMVVVGGGISAAQVVLAAAEVEQREVVLLSRHVLRTHRFDAEPCWLGPKCMTHFSRVRSLDERRAMIDSARHRGSIPDEIMRRLRQLIHERRISHRVGEIVAADVLGDRVVLHTRDFTLAADDVVLATGFSRGRPGGAFIDRAVDGLSLEVSACGFPVLTSSLEWSHGLFVTGGLAELELGPTARNVAGAREAARRIANVAVPRRRARA
jgi:hypothetical protein